jgi:hypothetical protein
MRFLFWLFFVVLITTSACANEKKMKEINYFGGIVKFNVPESWVEEYEYDQAGKIIPESGGMYYEKGPNTGTFRLVIITYQPHEALSSNSPYEALASTKSIEETEILKMDNGNAITTSIKHSSDQGQAITLYKWNLANPALPNHIRIAMFSYTVLTSLENDPKTKMELEMLTESVKNAKFNSTVGLY